MRIFCDKCGTVLGDYRAGREIIARFRIKGSGFREVGIDPLNAELICHQCGTTWYSPERTKPRDIQATVEKERLTR